MGGGRRRSQVVEVVMTESGRQYSAGTVEHNAIDRPLFSADGKKSGHGTIAWLPAPDYAVPAGQDWPPAGPRGVIALLDTGVRPHPWLPEDEADQLSFVVKAEEHGWSPPLPDDDTPPAGDYSSHWGHATFIAGLIRVAAPAAQVLSMRVMNSQGKVSEDHVAETLTWLADHPELPVNIVLMAFGRPEDPDDEQLDDLRTPIKRLTDRGVRIVASAGNDGAERPVYPAAFAAESNLVLDSHRPVLSVGAFAAPTERAPYSNFGPWVTHWRTGTNIASIMPLTIDNISGQPLDPGNGYAWWSGTSFAAAAVAAQLANELPPGLVIPPKPASGS
jgi:subtilisin family serine protease